MEERAVSKVMWRLIPFMMVLYIFNYLDRVNISVAKLQLFEDLKFNDTIYGYGAAIFFPAYFIFEVPSNMLLEKYGARVWIARIMISWGIVSAAFVFMQGEYSFYVLRFLLGAAEAGFFPGMLLYLTYWIPAKNRANVGAVFMTSIALSGVIGNPLSGFILQNMKNVGGLRGWQWLFLLESIPTILLGVSVYFLFTDKPEQATWLDDDERNWLSKHLEAERAATKADHGSHSLMDAFKSWRVWVLSIIYMALMMGFYHLNYWTPTIVKNMQKSANGDLSEGHIGLLASIPFIAAIIGMVIIGRIADRTGRRKETLIGTMTLGFAGLLIASQTTTTVTTLAGLSLAAIGIFGSLAPFWTLPSAFLTGSAAAAGIAFINSVGNLVGGFYGNKLKGSLMDRYHSHEYGMLIDAGAMLLGIIFVLMVRTESKKTEAIEAHA